VLLLDELLPAEEKEGLVAAVVNLRQNNRPAYVGVRQKEERRNAVGIAGLGLRILVQIEEEPVLHVARAAVGGGQSMDLIGSGFANDIYYAAGGISVFSGQRGGQHFDVFHVVQDGTDDPGAA